MIGKTPGKRDRLKKQRHTGRREGRLVRTTRRQEGKQDWKKAKDNTKPENVYKKLLFHICSGTPQDLFPFNNILKSFSLTLTND